MGLHVLAGAEMIGSPEPNESAFVGWTHFEPEPGHGQVAGAELIATAHGINEARLNDNFVSDRLLAPGWTSYDRRLQVQVYPLPALKEEGNSISF